MKDLTFRTEDGVLNIRVTAVIVHENRLLTVEHGDAGYYALPGGRVKLGEAMDDAIRREVEEELGFVPAGIRPLWLNQGFFTAKGTPYHELCLYYLVDFTGSGLLSRGECFTGEDAGMKLTFRWLPFEALPQTNLVPRFIRTKINHLPEHLELIENRD